MAVQEHRNCCQHIPAGMWYNAHIPAGMWCNAHIPAGMWYNAQRGTYSTHTAWALPHLQVDTARVQCKIACSATAARCCQRTHRQHTAPTCSASGQGIFAFTLLLMASRMCTCMPCRYVSKPAAQCTAAKLVAMSASAEKAAPRSLVCLSTLSTWARHLDR